MLFGPSKVAVFVDGCFWHSCPVHGNVPSKSTEWWTDKLRRNKLRDADADKQLVAAGWLAMRIWEHEDPVEAIERVRKAVHDRRWMAARPSIGDST